MLRNCKNRSVKRKVSFAPFEFIKHGSCLAVLVAFLLMTAACSDGSSEAIKPTPLKPSAEAPADALEVATILPTPTEIVSPPLPAGSEAFEGYTLFNPLGSTTTYLIDNAGDIAHTWESNYRPGQSVYFLENGNLLRTANIRANRTFKDGAGNGGLVQEIAWDGSLVWEFEYTARGYLQHHDIEALPNGNVLMIAWEVKSPEDAIAAGRSPDLLSGGTLWPDHIIEVAPDGMGGGTIVWEWHIWDHLVQDYDPNKENYGVVADHPELINLNYVGGGGKARGGADWTHTNSVDYNAELDQILLSVHNFNEIWVIDHSTTMQEAAGHSGGNSGKGGDILYRWGNPLAYSAGSRMDQQFFGQHDAQWVEAGLPGEGNILVFNNGMGRPDGAYSSVVEITPPVDVDGSYILSLGFAFEPDSPVWLYTAENPEDFYSQNISGVQRLPNGNTLICQGANGIFFEVTIEGEIVWRYELATQGIIDPQQLQEEGQPDNRYSVFKIRRYAADYPGLAYKDLK